MASITGTITRIRLFKEEDGYTIILVNDAHHTEHTIVCYMTAPSVGMKYTFEGEFVTHRVYGRQLQASKVTEVAPSSVEGMLAYLANGPIRGVGPAIAKRLVDAFGEETFDIIDRNPTRLLAIEGISRNKLDAIVSSWHENKQSIEAISFLRGHNVGPNRAVAIYNTYKEKTIDVVSADPYRLAFEVDGIGFELADSIASSLDIEDSNPTRIKAGIHHVLKEASKSGNVGLAKADLLRQSRSLLKIDKQEISKGLDSMTKDKQVIVDDVGDRQVVYLPFLRLAEDRIAYHLKRLSGKSVLTYDIEHALKQSPFPLSDTQQAAHKGVLENKLSILTGGPGVGKTTILKATLDAIQYKNRAIKAVQVAPTGRAAQRMSESTGMPAETIHRLLKFDGTDYNVNADSPLDVDLIIIDESSMVDTELMFRLLESLPTRATVIIVGDKDQLPSVGPGSIIRDLIESGAIPVSRLTEVRRQGKGSNIITNAHAINRGDMPEAADDFMVNMHKEQQDSVKDISALLVDTLPKKLGIRAEDIQILTPSHKGNLGTVALNKLVQDLLNPNPPRQITRADVRYGVGDKVMQTRNDPKLGVFNGDVGWIVDIDFQDKSVSVQFDRGVTKLSQDEMRNIQLAWAVTIHKSQGSEYPAVIIPMSSEHYMMLARNLLYTAVTRGKEQVAIVGDQRALRRAVTNNPQVNRVSGLKERLWDYFDMAPPVNEEEEDFAPAKKEIFQNRLHYL